MEPTPRQICHRRSERGYARSVLEATEADFDRMRQKIDAGAQPWTTSKNVMLGDDDDAIDFNILNILAQGTPL